MSFNILELIQYITWLATEREEALSPIRLVKFLYLVDLYNARKNKGQTLTGWPWKFVHYGPFCSESLNAIKEAVEKGYIESYSYESKFDEEEHFLYRYKADQEPTITSQLPFYIVGQIQAAIKKWADDTFALLDYVYFETEPMAGIKPGDLLDFSKSKETPVVHEISMKKLSKKKLTEGKEIIAKMRDNFNNGLQVCETQAIYDEVYSKALDFLNGEDLNLSITGKAVIEDTASELD
jgi:hypothetical protein